MSIRDKDEPQVIGPQYPQPRPLRRLSSPPRQIEGEPELAGPRHRGHLADADGSWLVLGHQGGCPDDTAENYSESGLRGTSPPADATSNIS